MKIVSKYLKDLNKVLFHSYTSNETLAHFVIDNNFMLGFNGIVTFRAADNVRSIVDFTPVEKMVIETDAPFLTPEPHRGKENSPIYLKHILNKIAEIKKLDLDMLAEKIYNNSLSFFNLD